MSIIAPRALGLLFLSLLPLSHVHAGLQIAYDAAHPQLRFAVAHLEEALLRQELAVFYRDLASLREADVIILSTPAEIERFEAQGFSISAAPEMAPEGFRIIRLKKIRPQILVLAHDPTGAMYGTLDLAEQLRMHGRLDAVEEKAVNPRFSFRAVKFNLPWSAYRDAPPTDLHRSVCRDLDFWRRFLDMMALNRFNALTLWNLHPFPYMVSTPDFPEATPFSEAEMAEWKAFWKMLFRMAKDRGIETYIINWNIVVSPEMAEAYGVKVFNDTSEVVKRYTRASVTALINAYEDLTGIGVTLADWMNDMTPREREDWIEETFVAGMKAADRPVKFIHRSVLAGSPLEMRRVIDKAELPDPVWVEVKFNWSHGHSTPRLAMTHDYESGEIDERFWNPAPTNYKIAWMIRNEDFFILRWGEPDFIREHMAVNDKPYVDGYFVGSEGYTPAKDYAHELDAHQTWQYAFEKQWLFYTLWGRLLYDPDTPDAVFEAAFDHRYRPEVGAPLLRAYRLSSRMPLRLASFHAATWDYTLYSEGFLAPARSRGLSDTLSPFISILELIEHETLDPTYLSIPEYVEALQKGQSLPEEKVTPLELAEASERDGRAALEALEGVRPYVTSFSGAVACEMLDAEAWSYLSLYFAEKLRAGVALETFRRTGASGRQQEALHHLENAAAYWDRVIAATEGHYRPTPHVFMERFRWSDSYPEEEGFSWTRLREQVQRDLDLARTAEPLGP